MKQQCSPVAQSPSKQNWWFGTWMDYFSILYMGCHPNPTDEVHDFSRWAHCTTNQAVFFGLMIHQQSSSSPSGLFGDRSEVLLQRGFWRTDQLPPGSKLLTILVVHRGPYPARAWVLNQHWRFKKHQMLIWGWFMRGKQGSVPIKRVLACCKLL